MTWLSPWLAAATHRGVDLAAAHGEMVVAAVIVLSGEEILLRPLDVLRRSGNIWLPCSWFCAIIVFIRWPSPAACPASRTSRSVTLDCHRPARHEVFARRPPRALSSATSATLAFFSSTCGPLLHAASGSAQAIKIAADFMASPLVGSALHRPAPLHHMPSQWQFKSAPAWPNPKPARPIVPHKPARPDKAEGGKPFKLVVGI